MSPALRLKFLEKLFGKRDAVVPEKLSDENAKKFWGIMQIMLLCIISIHISGIGIIIWGIR